MVLCLNVPVVPAGAQAPSPVLRAGRRGRLSLHGTSLAVLAIALLASCATTPPLLKIDALTNTRAIWGIDVEDDEGHVLYAQNAHKLMVPASNRKLFTAAFTADCFGFEQRFTTELWRDGDDLILRGGGDPSFGSAAYYASPGDAFAPMLAAVHERGITHVRDVIADVSSFDRTTIPPTWKIGNLTSAYAAPADALAYHENALENAAVANPALHSANALRDLLILDGVTIDGAVRFGSASGERIAMVQSPPLYELLATMLKESQNLYAEMLLKSAGEGTYGTALAREQAFAPALGIDPHELRFVDGSGLSPDNLVTPAAVVQLLRWMHHRGVWWQLLAAPNEAGTLQKRLIELQPRLRGKTGTLSGVSAVSGIMTMPDGHTRYFSAIVDHNTMPEISKTLDAIVREVANGERPSRPQSPGPPRS